MKIEKKTMVDFLKEVSMNEVDSCLLRFEEDGLRVDASSRSQTHNSYGFLPKDKFEEYVAIGNVGVDELTTIIKIFSRLGKELEFEIEGNLLTCKGKNTEVRIPLVEEKFIEEVKPVPSIDFVTEYKLNVKDVNAFIADCSHNKDFKIIIETVSDGVKLKNTGKFGFTYNLEAEGAVKGESVKLGKPLIQVMKNVEDGVISVSEKTDYPLLIEHDTDNYNVKFIMAPVIKNE